MRRPGSAGFRTRKKKGRWTKEEHERFLLGMRHCDRDWKAIGRDFVASRSETQIRTHAQKFFRKTEQGLPFPNEPYESTEKQQPAVPAFTPALDTAASTASPTVKNDDVAGSAATEPASMSVVDTTAAATAPAPAPVTPSPFAPALSDFVGIPTEMQDEVLSHLLYGMPIFSFPWSLPSLHAFGDQTLVRSLGPALENWDSLDYHTMDGVTGDNSNLLPAEETRCDGGQDDLPATSTMEDNEQTSTAETIASAHEAAPAEDVTLGWDVLSSAGVEPPFSV